MDDLGQKLTDMLPKHPLTITVEFDPESEQLSVKTDKACMYLEVVVLLEMAHSSVISKATASYEENLKEGVDNSSSSVLH